MLCFAMRVFVVYDIFVFVHCCVAACGLDCQILILAVIFSEARAPRSCFAHMLARQTH